MGRKCNDVYGEEKVYYYPGAIVRVAPPDPDGGGAGPADEDSRRPAPTC